MCDTLEIVYGQTKDFIIRQVSRKITPYKNLTKYYQDQQWIKVIDSSSQNQKIMLNGSEMSALSLLG